jgi:hypothetical protein
VTARRTVTRVQAALVLHLDVHGAERLLQALLDLTLHGASRCGTARRV